VAAFRLFALTADRHSRLNDRNTGYAENPRLSRQLHTQ
jgi:hypothetical protein